MKSVMRIITLVVCIIAVDCLAAETSATPSELRYGPIRGESLVTIGGNYTHSEFSNSSSSDSLTGQIGLGYFLDNHHEVGFQGIISHIENKSKYATNTTSLIGCYPYYNFNFHVNPRSWLYAGPHAGIVYSEFEDDNDITWSIGLHAGWRYWLTPTASAFVESRFTHTELDFADNDEFQILFGLNLRF